MLLLEGFSNFYKLQLLFLDQLENWSNRHLAVGAKQSPIPLEHANVVHKQLPPLKFHNYDKLFIPILDNTGHTVRVLFSTETDKDNSIDTESLPYIEGGPLDGKYILREIHFHWDSEHTLDGRTFPLESHFVHYKQDYHSIDEALDCNKGLCVLASFYEISKCDNYNFEVISEAVQEVCDEVGSPVKCENEICCRGLLPKYTSSFYSYEGSLTVSDFNENVIWIILGEPGLIGRAQLKSLTSITNEALEPVKKNRRELQKLEGREVTYTSSFLSRVRKAIRKCTSTLFGTLS